MCIILGKLDPDPYESGKLDPDLNPHQIKKQDPQQREKVEVLEGHFWSIRGSVSGKK
jgi:hypothetical protein